MSGSCPLWQGRDPVGFPKTVDKRPEDDAGLCDEMNLKMSVVSKTSDDDDSEDIIPSPSLYLLG